MEPIKEKPPRLFRHSGAQRALSRWDPVHVIADTVK
ncbi:hypothetical protein NC651_022785 [Populus alba x Populus x berolinensis]|nr:hypothetical protein NC651_022785 [Populus alba x Populus x berolinensis]